MVIETIAYDFSICKVDFSVLIPHKKFYFSAITDEEISLVCPTEEALEQAIARDDGWKAVRIRGVLDFLWWAFLRAFRVFWRKRK